MTNLRKPTPERLQDARVTAKAVLDLAYGPVLKEQIPESIDAVLRGLK